MTQHHTGAWIDERLKELNGRLPSFTRQHKHNGTDADYSLKFVRALAPKEVAYLQEKTGMTVVSQDGDGIVLVNLPAQALTPMESLFVNEPAAVPVVTEPLDDATIAERAIEKVRQSWAGAHLPKPVSVVNGNSPRRFAIEYAGGVLTDAQIENLKNRGLLMIAALLEHGLVGHIAFSIGVTEDRWKEWGFPADAPAVEDAPAALLTIEDVGMTEMEAAAARGAFGIMAEDWDSSDMDVYDALVPLELIPDFVLDALDVAANITGATPLKAHYLEVIEIMQSGYYEDAAAWLQNNRDRYEEAIEAAYDRAFNHATATVAQDDTAEVAPVVDKDAEIARLTAELQTSRQERETLARANQHLAAQVTQLTATNEFQSDMLSEATGQIEHGYIRLVMPTETTEKGEPAKWTKLADTVDGWQIEFETIVDGNTYFARVTRQKRAGRRGVTNIHAIETPVASSRIIRMPQEVPAAAAERIYTSIVSAAFERAFEFAQEMRAGEPDAFVPQPNPFAPVEDVA